MNFDVIGTMNQLENRLEDVSEDLDVAVIGCYVNGPGESKHVSIGVTEDSPKTELTDSDINRFQSIADDGFQKLQEFGIIDHRIEQDQQPVL